MKVRILSDVTHLLRAVGTALTEAGFEVEVVHGRTRVYELRHRPGIRLASLSRLTEVLRPMAPALVPGPDVEEADVELHLGDTQDPSAWDLKIYADAEPIAGRLRSALTPLGHAFDGVEVTEVEEDVLRYGGATGFVRDTIRWLAAREGLHLAERKAWGDDDNDLWVYARDPIFDGRDLKPLLDVELVGDDLEVLGDLRSRLEALGFGRIQVRTGGGSARFELNVGPFSRDEATARLLRETVEAVVGAAGVDDERFPLLAAEPEGIAAEIQLPLGAWRRGELRPYVGAWPERWDLTIRTDRRERVQPLVEKLAEAGYGPVRYEPLPASSIAFAVRWGAAAAEDTVARFVEDAVRGLRDALGADDAWSLTTHRAFESDSPRIVLDLPTDGLSREGWERRLHSACADWELSLKTARPDALGPLVDTLRPYGFKSFDTVVEHDVSSLEIKYGGAPPALVEHLADVAESRLGHRPTTQKVWGDTDDDIWLYVPDGLVGEEQAAFDEESLDLSAWFTEPARATRPAPLLDVGADAVRLGDLRLPRRSGARDPRVPSAEAFAHYCLDQRTAETLLHVAESVLLREPVLLEGETSVSKTSVVLYLAHLLDQPVVRINLNGQTDTGELVGRYVPMVSGDLPVSADALLARPELLDPASRRILTEARDAGRPLDPTEVQQVVARENLAQRPWTWQDGLVVAAMRRGWWVVLDELNLAEPQILERLNPVLEREPGLVLSEHDGEVLGGGGTPIHPDFRIFATMNPAEYAGRSALSPAYRDRWRGYRFVPSPGEREYHAMLRFLVHGEQPEVQVFGRRWSGAAQPAPMPALAHVRHVEPFLHALARFHAALEGAVGDRAGAPRLGARRRERYVFTRRGLLSVVDYLASAVRDGDDLRAMRTALYRYYLARVARPEDRAVVAQLLDAAGIGPTTWQLDAVPGSAGPDGAVLRGPWGGDAPDDG